MGLPHGRLLRETGMLSFRDVKTLDRYLLREILPPLALVLGVFTFLLAVQPTLEYARQLLVKGVDLPTVVWLLVLLLPSSLAVAIPMAFMAGVLMGLGRLSSDREAVALLACGVSPLRLLRPVLLLAVVAGAADMYVLMRLVPDWNQEFRNITFGLLARRGQEDIKPGVFYDGFPGKVIFIRERTPDGQWGGVMLADTSQPGRPTVTWAAKGYLELDPVKRLVGIVLPGESVRYVPGAEEGVYDTALARDFRVSVSAESVFGDGGMQARGVAEMSIAQLREAEARKRAEGLSPHQEIIFRHQMFAFPVACLIFALVGVALGLHTRKSGRLGGFVQGIAVIFVYYGILLVMQNLTKGGQFPAEWARWVPNIVTFVLALVALRWSSRAIGHDIGWPAMKLPWGPPASARSHSQTLVGPTRALQRGSGTAAGVVRLLDRYVARRYLSVSALSFFALLGIYYISTAIDKSERLFKGQASGAMLIEYFYYSTPQFVAYIVPAAALVAALATIGGLTRTSELVVIRACGVSLYRTAVPLLLIALLWSGGLFLLDDRVLAHANRKADELANSIRGNLPAPGETLTTASWLVDKSGRIYYYTAFDAEHRTLFGLSVFDLPAGQSHLESHTMAATATFADGRWRAGRGWVQHFPAVDSATRESFDHRVLQLPPPASFGGPRDRPSGEMTFGELRRHIIELEARGASPAESSVRLQSRIAFPLVTVVMTLLGVPFGATMGRRGALYGVGLALVLGAMYWLLNTFFVAVGEAGLLEPALAAWATNLLFLSLAAYALLTART